MKKLKTVNKIKNPGLAKLPKEVRNKMGYMKEGGEAKAKEKLRVARGAAARVGSSNAMLKGRPLSRIQKKILENSKKESLNLLKGKGPTAREKAIKELSKMDRKPMMKKGGKANPLLKKGKKYRKITEKTILKDLKYLVENDSPLHNIRDLVKQVDYKKKQEKAQMKNKNIKGDIAKPTMMEGGQVQASSQIGDAVATYQDSGNYKAGE